MMPKATIYFASYHPAFAMLPLQWGLSRAHAERDETLRRSYDFAPPFFLPQRRPEDFAKQMTAPFVFAASCYVWNFRFHMELCRLAKAVRPDCVTVAGGPHMADEVDPDFFRRHPHLDVIVHGEGEVTFASLLRELLNERPDLTSIPGITFNADRRPVRTGPPRALPREISDDEVPSPYLLSYFHDAMISTARNATGTLWCIWETNRGCPYRCTFCEWGASGRPRTMPPIGRRLSERHPRGAERTSR